ncbi:16S rRNA (cytidine(1402)-2'-O)-methyltransferase [Shimia ponticola]|uniref:16S rRNA (cytidine(1402)-2'-O)-methyltransferase n=1 Tax=Shimia ponticola TaxID=2582893 RepID=UPI0011BD71F0|nr:16S rRNA (cytidine(1402)-2'-O)-methyltransferase [Shimia ponticola]
MNFRQQTLAPALYLVATPIGSARDITLRALDVLASADVLAAEDTRNLRKLMEIHGIPLEGRRVLPYHDHNGSEMRPKLIEHVRSGRSVAYASDAGTPLIADPGYHLASEMRAAGLAVTTAPGPSAVITALSLSALPTDQFHFAGFLPNAKAARQSALMGLRDLSATLILYEAPGRVEDLLTDICEVYGGERPVSLCRELTKRFEEVRHGRAEDVLDSVRATPPKGECVVLIGRAETTEVTDDMIRAALQTALETMRIKDAATAVSGSLSVPRRQVYQIALDMKSDG